MKLTRIHHVHFATPDLDRMEAFAGDFGLIVADRTPDRLLMRTNGGEAFSYRADRADKAAFVGFGLEVESGADLDAAARLPGASARHPLDGTQGAQAVTLVDPNGFQVTLIAGLAPPATTHASPDLRLNSPTGRVRHGESQRGHEVGPATLYRLGHVGLFVTSFAESATWYRDTLGLIGSEIYHVPGDPAHQVVGFFRLDRGDEWVDHHTIALMQRPTADCHHISFEAQDFESQFVAHRYLAGRGHEPVWGVGRHPHGSHVFDVWRDPGGWRFETFSDTDLLQARAGTRIHDIRDVQMDLWSSDPPDRYFA